MDISMFKHPVLLFSGGKDSLAALVSLRDHWEHIEVAWANPGAPHPRVAAYMQAIKRRVPHFVELTGKQPEWVKANGWPVDVLPCRSVLNAPGVAPGRMAFAPYQLCCGANMWRPIAEHIARSGADLVITGQRRADALRNFSRDEEFTTIDGVLYWNILNDWSDAQVFRYLEKQGEPLPPMYADGAASSTDCWNCTAYLDHNAGRIRHMRAAEPDRWQVIKPVLAELDRQLREDQQPLIDLLEA
jgi:phosphoadenosine phosphosulfate reductase